MSDYELLYLCMEASNNLQSTLMNFVAVLFAFLIAGYLVADKLDSKMVFILVTLFTLLAYQQVMNTFGFSTDFVGLVNQIQERVLKDPSGLGWTGAASSFATSAFGARTVSFGGIIILIASYIGALTFFFHQRHVGRAQ